jgi:hypothetical protein
MKVYILATVNPDAHNHILYASESYSLVLAQIPPNYNENPWGTKGMDFIYNSSYLSIIEIETEVVDNSFNLIFDFEEYYINFESFGKYGSQSYTLELDKTYTSKDEFEIS